MNINEVICFKQLHILMPFILLMGVNPVTAMSNDNIAFKQPLDTNKWIKVSDTRLAHSRGGFILPNGVIVHISFENLVLQNGEEISSSYFKTTNSDDLIKNGKVNIPELSNSQFQTIIQNNLDNQTLQTINNINIDINNLNNINLIPSDDHFYNLHSLSLTINP